MVKSKKRGKGKIGGAAKENIAAVFTRLGGTAAMARWAKKNQTEFYRLYGRLLPHEVSGPDGTALQFAKVVREVIDPKK